MLLKGGCKLESTAKIKKQLAAHLNGGEAFLPVDEMLKEVKFSKLGERPGNLPYSFYELFYHMRFAQKDILDYCTAEDYKSHNWPEDYWPEYKAPGSAEEWEQLKSNYFTERQQFIELLMDPESDLLAPVRKDTEHTLLREVLLVIEHSAYHSGQLLVVLRNLGLHQG